ncbi:hypothetical protein F2Q69_00057556 [Brassica cretica]|uniref:Uncharacterized protein n=1 Tax=Brassica cretica TaxID=69181 RepID=A0A8S9MR70_BRACR|nr:hypothetical protein F2Q69_00057556 [Brassica cretica]
MTKKKKQKAKSASGSPSGSACHESSVSRSSAPPSSEMVVEVVSDPSDPASPCAVTATKAAAEDPLFAVNGAVTATESVGAHGNPNSEIEGAVTATLEEGVVVRPPIVTPATIPIVHAEAITNFVGAHENPSSEIEGAVIATVEDGELVPPPSVTPATTLIVPEGKSPITEAEQSSSPQICDATTAQTFVPELVMPPKEPSSASKKQQRAVKNNTDRVLQIQEAPGPSAPPPRKDFLVVDLNAADSISADDDNPPTESDHFIEPPKEPSSASKKQQRAVKNNTDRVLQIQEAPGPSAPPPRKDFLVVDLNAADSISADDDNPPTESDHFIEVMTRKMKKQLLGKARDRGLLNL